MNEKKKKEKKTARIQGGLGGVRFSICYNFCLCDSRLPFSVLPDTGPIAFSESDYVTNVVAKPFTRCVCRDEEANSDKKNKFHSFYIL